MTDAALLTAFQQYLNTAEPFDDLELVPRYALLSELATGQQAALTPIAQHHSHSLLALWQAPDGSQPVVWLDSEGSAGVMANSLREFLSISPYGIGTLSDIMDCYGDERSADDSAELLELKFPTGEISARLAEQQDNVEGSRAYQRWLADRCGIQLAPDPLAVVGQANAAHPGFAQWLAESA